MAFFAKEIETAPRSTVESYQFKQLRHLLKHTYENNPFYHRKFNEAGFKTLDDVLHTTESPEAFRQLPATTKPELLADQAQHSPYGSNLAISPELFVRQHQTSGTTGKPLRVWETRESWDWLTRLWLHQFAALEITRKDIIFMAFNFGHALGMWNVLYAGMEVGALTLTGGGLTSIQRLESIVNNHATVLVCTPTYALRLAEIAAENRISIRDSSIRMIIAAGEPGGSIPGTKDRIENLWNARLYDSPGATEVGHIGCVCLDYGIHVIESEFYFEFLAPETLAPAKPGDPAEIVVTNFGRPATPVIRYRTCDVAKAQHDPCACGRTMLRLDGGVIGRSDDMFVVRGVNVFPSAIEAIIRETKEVTEYAVEVFKQEGMYGLDIKLEVNDERQSVRDAIASRVAHDFHRKLYLRANVEIVPSHSLPRSEGKSKRISWRDLTGPVIY